MIGIQVITHGGLAKGLIDTVNMIIGDTDKLLSNSLLPDEDFDEFSEKVLDTTNNLNDGSGVLVFTDLYAASPYRAALSNSRKLKEVNYKIISGVNLPLLIEAITTRETYDIDTLYKELMKIKNETIQGWENK